MSILINLLLALNVIVAVLIVLIVLMQRPKNEGLGAAFGGGMMDDAFGAQTTNVLSNLTRWLGGIFFFLSLVLTYLYSNFSTGRSTLDQRLRSAPVPVVATPAPAVPGSPSPTPAGSETPTPLSLEMTPPAPGEQPAAPAPEVSAPAPAETAPAPAPATAPVAPAPAAAPASSTPTAPR